MQRLVWALLVIGAGCGGSTGTGAATLSGTPVKSAAASVFTGADGGGNMVLGWKLELFEGGPGTECLDEEAKIAGSIGIFTNQPGGSKPQALLPTGGISIVTMSPPMVVGNAAATMGLDGIADIAGIMEITEFHLLPDAMHADRIKGTITASGTNAGTMEAVALNGMFEAPVCVED
jgi:hypothetical protein